MLSKPHIDPQEYRNAMARYAGHVQIVTTAFEGALRGVTITAACSVSDSPPMVLVCLNHGNPHNDIFSQSGIFALNTLGEEHQTLANHFSGFSGLTEEERFEQAEWDVLATGAPVLRGAIANYDCRIVDVKRASTHNVFFGEVAGLRLGNGSKSLVYMDRGYHAI
ncbi:flavin reductase family protein [Rhizobium sp. L1K21]|uniref:flavin reductase family protein n=1 Tax=Rhizobium sp. L1K21 TaxID=2954933 RepID=UPI00209219B2|nr:flavin reductase family protein [Rhizobium sp. L1K21]MCO6185749.1 flavin reductase family protein [Rhizobium sp. L1K21]